MPSIVYRFVEDGAEDVARAFQTVKKSATEAQRAQRTYNRESTARAAKAPQQDAHVKARDKHEREQTRIKEREEKKRQRLEEQSARKSARLAERAEEHKRKLAIATTQRALRDSQAAERKQRQAMFARRQHMSRMSAAVVGSVVGSLAMGGLGMAAKGANALVDLGGSAVRQRLDTKQLAIELSKSGRGAGQEAVSADLLLRDAERTAGKVTGTKAADVLQAQQKYVAMTGNLGEARGYGDMFAQMARASGSKESDIAATAATLQQKFGIKSEDEMKSALANLMFQGKAGAFEMSDASSYLQEMGAAGARFGLGEGAGGVKKLGALSQLARASTGSGAEASTAVQAMLTDITEKSGLIKKVGGADVFTDKSHTKTRAIEDIMADIMKGTKGDKAKLGSIFGERGMRGASSLIEAFNKGAEAAGKGASEAEKLAAGEKAMRKLFDDTVSAGGDWGEVLKDASAQSQSSLDQLSSGWESFTAKMGTALDPAIKALAEATPGIVAAMQPLFDATALLATAFGDVIVLLQRAGILSADKSGDETPEERISKGAQQLAALKKIEDSGGKLTSKQKMERARLLDDRIGAEQDLMAAHPELAAINKGDASLSAAKKKSKLAGPSLGVSAYGLSGPSSFEESMRLGSDLKVGAIREPGFFERKMTDLHDFKKRSDFYEENKGGIKGLVEWGQGMTAKGGDNGASAQQLEAANKLSEAADKFLRAPLPGLPAVVQ
jgi:TP901 family phage tail tape measure protein